MIVHVVSRSIKARSCYRFSVSLLYMDSNILQDCSHVSVKSLLFQNKSEQFGLVAWCSGNAFDPINEVTAGRWATSHQNLVPMSCTCFLFEVGVTSTPLSTPNTLSIVNKTYVIPRRLLDVRGRLLMLTLYQYSRHLSHCRHRRLPGCSCSSWNIQTNLYWKDQHLRTWLYRKPYPDITMLPLF